MITLPNGDKWIIDEREIKGLDYNEACKGNVPETSVDDFIKELVASVNNEKIILTPRKLTNDEGQGYWDCNFDPFQEVVGAVAKTTLTTPFFTAYEMPSGEVHVVYSGADSGGYDVCCKIKTYANRLKYMKAVSFPK